MTMSETRKMAMEVRGISAALMVVVGLLSMIFFPGEFKSITMGIVIGTICGLMGFNMICNMAERIDGDTLDVKNRATRSYTRRYLLYAIIFALSASVGVNLIALLVGMLVHKLSILFYTLRHRKEDD